MFIVNTRYIWHIMYYANIICKKSRNHLQNATSTTWTAYKLQDLQTYTNHISVWPTKKTTKKTTPSNSLHKNTRTQGEPWIIDGHVSPQGNEKRFSAGEARRGFLEDSAGKSRGVFFPWRKWWILQCWNDIWYILRTIRWFKRIDSWRQNRYVFETWCFLLHLETMDNWMSWLATAQGWNLVAFPTFTLSFHENWTSNFVAFLGGYWGR